MCDYVNYTITGINRSYGYDLQQWIQFRRAYEGDVVYVIQKYKWCREAYYLEEQMVSDIQIEFM